MLVGCDDICRAVWELGESVGKGSAVTLFLPGTVCVKVGRFGGPCAASTGSDAGRMLGEGTVRVLH